MPDLLAIPFDGGSVAADGTPRCVVSALAQSTRRVVYAGLELFGSVAGAEKNLTVEVCRCTDAGTGTTATPVWMDGVQTIAPVTTAKQNITTEPAAIAVVTRGGCDPSGGQMSPQLTGREVRGAVSGGIAIRITNPSGNTANTIKGTLYLWGA